MHTGYTHDNSNLNNSDHKPFSNREDSFAPQNTQNNTGWSAATHPETPTHNTAGENITGNTSENTSGSTFDTTAAPPNDGINNNTTNEEKLEKKSERFIISALLSAVIIIAIIIGLGWAVFYPKNNVTTAINNDITETQPSQEPQNNSGLEQNIDNDVIIFYGEKQIVATVPEENIKEPISPTQAQTTTSLTPAQVKKQNTTPIKKLGVVKEKPTSVPAPVPVPLVANTAAKKVIKPPAPIQKEPSLIPKKTAQGIIVVPNVKKHVYWVQVFSTSNKNKANILKNDLEKTGIVTSIITKNIDEKVYYRLRIGPYYNKAEGTKFLQWIKQTDKFKDAYVTLTYI